MLDYLFIIVEGLVVIGAILCLVIVCKKEED